jgi:hypothetical protein
MGGNGTPVIGVFGSEDTEHIQSLGLLFMNIPAAAPPPDPPRNEKPATRPADPPRNQKPATRPADPPREEKPAEQPADPPKVEQRADAPRKAAEPIARTNDNSDNATAEEPASAGMIWIPIAMFGTVTLGIFVALLLSSGRKEQIEDFRPRKLDLPQSLPATAAPSPPPASTAICEQPRPAGEGRRPGGQPAKKFRLHEQQDNRKSSPSNVPPAQVPGAKPSWRAYRHSACGSTTVVSGDDYVLLECPFRPVSGTFCCGCKRFVPLDEVKWADSGETIAAYRKRVASTVPFWRKVYLFLFGTAYEGAVNWGVEWKGEPESSAE